MKTEIEKIYRAPDGYIIERALPVDVNRVVLILYGSGDGAASRIELLEHGEVAQRFELQRVSEYNPLFYGEYGYTIAGEHLVITLPVGKLVFFELTQLHNFFLFDILNYPGPDDGGRRTSMPKIAYSSLTGSFAVALKMNGNSLARYVAVIVKNANGHYFMGGRKMQLPKMEFPISKFAQDYPGIWNESEWIHIREVFAFGPKINVHTLGCSHPRVASNVYSDFHFVAQLHPDLTYDRKLEVVDGLGTGSACGRYFLVNPREKTSKVMVYDVETMEIAFEIPLTARQNLGAEKNRYLKFDIFGNYFFVSHASFLHICRFI